MQFGAALSVGIDVDPKAIASAQQNASLNNIEPEKLQLRLVPNNIAKHKFSEAYISGKENFDIVIANILLNPLLDLADHVVSYAKPEAVVGLSGILSEQVTSKTIDQKLTTKPKWKKHSLTGLDLILLWSCSYTGSRYYRTVFTVLGRHIGFNYG